MVVFDIDGTIKNDQYPSSQNFLDIINKLKSENCFVTIATGRMSLSAKQNSVFIPNAPIITYQGAKILDYSKLNELKTVSLNKNFIEDIIDTIKFYELKTMIQYDDKILCDTDDFWLRDYAIRNEVDFVYDENYENAKLNNPLRIVAVGDPSRIYDIENVLVGKFSDDVYVTRSLPHFCEILNHEADKSYSIEWICNYLKIKPNQVLTFGDSYNDIKMLKNIGYGVAVKNAVPELKEVSDDILKINGVEGIYHYLNELLN
jgi:Cof subfamily protein (haloacid dehalogenase superfamily)